MQLAVIDHNGNVGRGVATTISGDEGYKCVYPKLQKQWVAKPLYEEKLYQFVHNLMGDAILLKKGETEVPTLKGHTLHNILHQIPVETKKTSSPK